MKKKFKEILEDALFIIFVIFVVYIAYQIIKAILGGSWTDEQILMGLCAIVLASFFIIVGFLINQAKSIGKIESDLFNLKGRFDYIGKDLKEHLTKSNKK